MSQNLYEKLMGKYESCPDDPMAKFAKVGSYVILFLFIRSSRNFSVAKIYCHGQAPGGECSIAYLYFAFNAVIIAPFIFGDRQIEEPIFTRKYSVSDIL